MQCRINKRATQKTRIAHIPSLTVEEEVENVEYLDECVTDDIEEVNENPVNNSPAQHRTKTETTLEDTFYPNAVHCLIALYRDKYEKNMNDPQEIQKLYESVWEDISKDMHESYFEFDARRVRQKFTQLRRQYFCVSSKKEADEFVYFQPLHQIYNDKLISNAINNEKLAATARKSKQLRIHRDDALFTLHIETATRAIEEERTMHAAETSLNGHNRNMECKDASVITNYKRERSESKEASLTNLRYSKRKLPNPQSEEISDTKEKSKADMTLADYNDAQQRRHEEKMSLLRQTLLLQQRALDIQNRLLEEIINRVK